MRICEAGRDACGCKDFTKGIRTIDGQYPDDNREFAIQAGSNISIIPITAGIEISASVPTVPGPMVFKGTLGTGGTISSLPPATAANIGYVYVAIESGTVPVTYEIGDMVISNGLTWVVVPSGDDPVDWSQIQNKPTTVSGYGITDAVDTGSIQNISGIKKFTSGLIVLKNNAVKTINFVDTSDALKGHIQCNNAGAIEIKSYVSASPITAVGQRSYLSSNTDDIVTIGTLKTATDVVHTTGNETIAGVKTFTDGLVSSMSAFATIDIKSARTSGNVGGLRYYDGNGTLLSQIAGNTDGHIYIDLNGTNKSVQLTSNRGYNAAYTSDVATIGIMDAYTPMVRTTGNQTKSGAINFSQSGADAQITKKRTDTSYPSGVNRGIHLINVYSGNDVLIGRLYLAVNSDNTTSLGVELKNSDGTTKDVILAQGDVI